MPRLTAGARQAARQREPSLQDDGLQPRQLLTASMSSKKSGELALQEISRKKPVLKTACRRISKTPSFALAVEQPRSARSGLPTSFASAGSRSHPWRALRVAAPRLGDHEEAAQGLEAKTRPGGLVLTEAQVIALERAKTEKDAHGEFESEHPGYCGARTPSTWQHERCRSHLPADLHRQPTARSLRQALRSQDADHRRRDLERPCAAVLRRPRHCPQPGIDRPGHGILWQS